MRGRTPKSHSLFAELYRTENDAMISKHTHRFADAIEWAPGLLGHHPRAWPAIGIDGNSSRGLSGLGEKEKAAEVLAINFSLQKEDDSIPRRPCALLKRKQDR